MKTNQSSSQTKKTLIRFCIDVFIFYQLKSEISVSVEKLEKLLDAHLDGVISKEEYASKKQKLLNRKIEISEKLADFEHKGNYWLEPMRLFILEAKQAEIIASKENLPVKRDFLKKIGSNPLLRDKAISISLQNSWKILADFPILSAFGGQKFANCSGWLAWRDAFRTYDWRKAFPDPSVTIKQINDLLGIVSPKYS